jgi:ABC-type amino acid transport substrate-binding protein
MQNYNTNRSAAIIEQQMRGQSMERMMTPRTWMRQAIWFSVGLLIAMPMAWDHAAFAGTIDTIRSAQTIRIAYRDDARPFSYKDANSTEPTGFMVDLCRAVVKKLSDQLGLPGLRIAYVSVTATNRLRLPDRGG